LVNGKMVKEMDKALILTPMEEYKKVYGTMTNFLMHKKPPIINLTML